MIDSNGKARVIITNVSPVVEGGHFPAKTVINDDVIIAADIFGDGHDEVAASVFVKHEKDPDWTELPMRFVINDHWQAVLPANRTGFYEFEVIGWIDHFATWKKGLKKKFEAGQDIMVELLIGAELLEHAAQLAPDDIKAKLTQWVAEFKNPSSPETGVQLALSPEISETMYYYRQKDYITSYPQIFKIEVERKKAAFSTWYELFPRSASPVEGHHGTFKDVITLLPRVAQMGFDVLYFPPIHPVGEKNRKGKNNSLTSLPGEPGSPWAIGNRMGGHKAINPELGTLNDFKKLVTEAKKLGIEIAMDIAYQCAPDHPYVKEHPQWFKWRPDGTVQYAENPPKKYEDILPFNFETDDWENLWKELKSVIDYWIGAGISVFRIDNPHTKSLRFWEWMIREVRKEHPDTIFLAEAFTRPRIMERLAKAGFNQSYTYFTWRNSKRELEQYMNELTKSPMRYYFRPNFWPNTPDILPEALSSDGENAHIIRVLLAGTLSSNYGIYGPVYELNINKTHPGKEEYTDNEKYELKNWNWRQYTRTGEIITRLNRIRRQNAALQSTWNIDFAETTNESILCYVKTDQKTDNKLIIAVNMDVYNTQSAMVKIPMDKLGLGWEQSYRVTDMLSGSKYSWHGEWNFVELNPYTMPAHIFKVEPI